MLSLSFINQKSPSSTITTTKVLLATIFAVIWILGEHCNAKSIFSGRVPGTKWCGPSNDAANETDFGERVELDKCCHNHDRCAIRPLKKGLERFGLRNDDGYTKLHCICEKEFVDCLRDVGDTASILVGKAYYRLQKQCFMEYYPIIGCETRKTYRK